MERHRRCELWERRPGGRWEVTASGTFDALDHRMRHALKLGRTDRYSKGPVEMVALAVGDWPARDTTPSHVLH